VALPIPEPKSSTETLRPIHHAGLTVRGSDDVLIAKYGKGFRWWPNPESRRRGSQRWAVPAVDQWHPAASLEEISATFMARESTL
jgi:hypothetical protein